MHLRSTTTRSRRGLGSFLLTVLTLPLIAIPALGQAAATSSTTTASPPAHEELENKLAELYAASELPGFAVALIADDEVVYTGGFGFANRDRDIAFTPETVLNIGSISKTFIGIALMQAVERGDIDLDSDISVHLPYTVRHPRFPDQPITVRHLASHTSGIQDRELIYNRAYSDGETPEMSLGAYLEHYLSPRGKWFKKSNFTKDAPGEAFEYTNIGAALAAHVLENAVGVPFDRLTRRDIVEPLGMDDSGWSYATADRARHAVLYDGKSIVDPYTLVTYPDGGMRASVDSLARYLRVVMAGGKLDDTVILRPASVKTLLTHPGKLSGMSERDAGYGHFWSHKTSGVIGHSGGDPGITTAMFFNPETGRGRIFVTNTMVDNSELAASFRAVWEALDEAPLAP
ncbi:MAG: serine hydrolase domain-containing protein [Acidobacteriota bacterium]